MLIALSWLVYADNLECLDTSGTLEIVPRDAALDVPRDVQPKIVGRGCFADHAWAELSDAAGTIYARVHLDDDPMDVLVPREQLPAYTEFLVTIGDDRGSAVFGRFVTGDRLSEDLFEAPTVAIGDVWYHDESGEYGFAYRVAPAADPEGGSVVVVRSEYDVDAFVAHESVQTGVLSGSAAEAPARCLQVQQIGVGGASVYTTTCVERLDAMGCNSLGRPIGWLSVLILLGMRRR